MTWGKSWLQLLSASVLPCVVGMLKGKSLGHHHQGLRLQGDKGLSSSGVAVAEVGPQDQSQSGCSSQKLLCGEGSMMLFCVWITPESRRTQGHCAGAQRDKHLMVVGPQSPVSCEGPSYGDCLLAMSHWGFHRTGALLVAFLSSSWTCLRGYN